MKYISRNIVIKIINGYIIDSPTSINISYVWNIGSLLGIVLILQIVSGIVLAFNYSADIAFDSIQILYRDIWYGSIIRYMHINGAGILFILVYLHIGKGIYYGSYYRPRIGIWYVGIIIYLVMMATAFIGYTLPLGSMSYWGGTVIISMFSAIPYIGNSIVIFIWGNYSITNYTIIRFYAIHFILPFILIGIVIIHIIYLHISGSNNGLGISTNVDKIPFHPYYIYKDILGFIFIFIVYIIILLFNVFIFSDSNNNIVADPLVTPDNILPEFYFLAYYAILRAIPDKFIGVILMFTAIIILVILPYNSYIIRSNIYTPISRVIYWIYIGNFLLLTYLGGVVPSNINISISRICTIIYFIYYII